MPLLSPSIGVHQVLPKLQKKTVFQSVLHLREWNIPLVCVFNACSVHQITSMFHLWFRWDLLTQTSPLKFRGKLGAQLDKHYQLCLYYDRFHGRPFAVRPSRNHICPDIQFWCELLDQLVKCTHTNSSVYPLLEWVPWYLFWSDLSIVHCQ